MKVRLICFIFLMLGRLAWMVSIDEMLEAKSEKYSRKFRYLVWGFTSIFFAGFQVLINEGFLYYIRSFSIIIWDLSVARIFYRDPFWKIIVAEIVLVFSAALGETIGYLAFCFLGIQIEQLTSYSSMALAIVSGITNTITIFSYITVAYLWKKFNRFSSEMGFHKIFFILYCSFLLCILFLFEYQTLNSAFHPTIETNILISSFLCNFIFMFIVIRQSEKNSLEAKLSKSKEIVALKQKQSLEEENTKNELERISRLNLTTLTDVEHLLNQGKTNEAIDALETLAIRNQKEYSFCHIAIINVLLSEKKKVCEQYHIHFDVNLNFPKENSIQQMDLCSVFSNLLDNAIHACQYSSEEKYIRLESKVFGEYLIIQCENYAENIKKKQTKGHGLGQKIILDIANRYKGQFYTEYDSEKKHYYAQVTLCFRL